MIVESTPLLTCRPEPSGSDRRPDGADDDAFGRALTDVLTANRAERPTDRARRRPETAERRGPRAADRRQDRIDDEDDDRSQADKAAAADTRAERKQETDPHRTGPTPEHDDTNARHDEHSNTATDRTDPRVTAHHDDGLGSQHGVATTLAGLEGGTASEPVDAVAIESVENVDADPPVAVTPSEIEPAASETPSGADPLIAPEHTTAEVGVVDEGEVELPTPTAADPADAQLETDPDASIDEELVPEMERPGEQTVTAVSREHQRSGLGQVIADMLDTAGAEPPTESQASANTSPAAAMATGAGLRTENVSAEETASDESMSDDKESEAGGPNDKASSLAGDDSGAVTANAGAEVDTTSETVTNPRPTNPLTTGPNRSGDSTTAPAPTAPTPAPELVELHTTGLAERLRPAFAAVRRGLDGLDELRLRIQDENSGPIKVDIATVDNRVRVLLSAGNDDLMRQLGQERERLSAELRRAGFDQASIDIASEHGGERRNRYADHDPVSGRFRPQGGGSGGATSHDEVAPTSAHRGRPGSGLDLDL